MRWSLALLIVIVASIAAGVTAAGPVVVRLAEKLPVLLAVLLAAVFVRLARGMPSIPYDKVLPSRARTATKAFRALIGAYVHTFLIFVTAIILNLVISLLKPEELSSLPYWIAPASLALIDGLVVVSIVFLILSDVALAHTQADMMDEVTSTGERTDVQQTGTNVKKAFENAELPRSRKTDETDNGV
jgi:hypothetical protein